MMYKIRRVQLDNQANLMVTGKRSTTFITNMHLEVGGLYFLQKNQLYRVEASCKEVAL